MTRNSRNAGSNPGIAFGRHLPPHPTPACDQNNSDKTATKNHFGGNHPDGDGDEPDNGNPGDPDDGPGNHPNDHNSSNNDVQHNLADTIAMPARIGLNTGIPLQDTQTPLQLVVT